MVTGELLPVAGPVDVDADGSHREAVEDGRGQGGVAQVAAPSAQPDVGGDGGGRASVPLVDQAEQSVGRGGLVFALLDLAQADIVDDQQRRRGPATEPPRIGAVSEAGEKVVEEVHALGVADRDLLLTRAQGHGLQDVTLSGAALAGDDQVLGVTDEVEACQLQDERLVEAGLEGPVEGLEGLALGQAACVDAAFDPACELVGCLFAQDALQERARGRLFGAGPGEVLVQVLAGEGKTQDV